MTSTISFPGLGIGEFTINRTAFTIFGINVKKLRFCPISSDFMQNIRQAAI